jgi:hypothetical protein
MKSWYIGDGGRGMGDGGWGMGESGTWKPPFLRGLKVVGS